ncbi:MAG: MFS transporter [Chitinophagaceae bacterium]|nr:MAG: MFS transporter [Chitinophagaceae bacterium]
MKPTILSALVMTFAALGDAFLYSALPVYALEMNVPLIWVGLVLSINRFVRLIANPIFPHLFNRFGFKRITIIAASVSIITTCTYGLAGTLAIWIVARVAWGFSFAALRISATGHSLQHEARGLSLGLSKALQELGPVAALLTGPLLLNWIGPAATFLTFALLSLTAVLIAFQLPELKHLPHDFKISSRILPSSFNLLTFVSTFVVQGILVVMISTLLFHKAASIAEIAALAGSYLAFRRICLVVISPLGGALADKFGMDKIYLLSIISTIAGLMLVATGATFSGLFTIFVFNSITVFLAPAHAVKFASNHLHAIATNSTWTDLGAAAGTLTGGIFLGISDSQHIFFPATFALMAATVFYIRSSKIKTLRLKWK